MTAYKTYLTQMHNYRIYVFFLLISSYTFRLCGNIQGVYTNNLLQHPIKKLQ